MSDDRTQAVLTETIGAPPALEVAQPRFDGSGARVALAALPQEIREPLTALYTQFAAVAEVEGAGPFSHERALKAAEALRGAAATVAKGTASAEVKGSVHEAVGARFAASSEHVPRWGRGRVTQAYSDQVRFLAQDQRRLWRSLFDGLDEEASREDAKPTQVPASAVLQAWDRPASDRDAEAFTPAIQGRLTGHVGSNAELAVLTRVVQALLEAAGALSGTKGLLLDAMDEPGLVRVAVVGGLAERTAGHTAALERAAGLVAKAFALRDGGAAVKARLAGERGQVTWVRWPSVP